MQMKNDMKVEKSVGMHSHAFERPCKCQIVTDPKSHNASHIWLTLKRTEICHTGHTDLGKKIFSIILTMFSTGG